MSATLRQFRRAPARIVASIVAMALAVGAIGVLAIPTVSEGTLHAAVGRDGLADLIVDTSPLTADTVAAVNRIPGVERAEGQAIAAVELDDGFLTRMIGLQLDGRTMDLVQLSAGRLPATSGEVVTTPAIAPVGDTVVVDGVPHDVVGHGMTLWWSGNDVLFAPYDSVAEITGGANRVVVTAVDDGADDLRMIADAMRSELEDRGERFVDFPVSLPDGSTPIDADIEQVSTLIGLLGVFAGLVALVLLASTANTLITERTREVAVMRALGGRSRALRRRLRRIALGITAAALVIGLPLGVLISNLIARMVLQEFVGVTPGFAVDWVVVAGSALGALAAARLVAARAARRVTRLPLAEALRDRDGAPFGGTWSHRWLGRLPTGGLFGRIAVRTAARRPARTVALVAQIGAAVGAAFLVPSLATSVNDFNRATVASWQWESVAIARDPGLPMTIVDRLDAPQPSEAGVWVDGEIAGYDAEIYGLRADTTMFDAELVHGRWFRPATNEVVLSDGFARRRGVDVGDDVELVLAGGPAAYRLVGTVDDAAIAAYTDRAVLADDLGEPGMANVIWSQSDEASRGITVPVRVDTAADLAADDEAGREAILLVFGAIGAIVAGVAALAVMSSMTVNLFERRHELAAMQALGARRRRLRRLIATELVPVGAVGLGLGLGLGALGTRGIMASFEASNSLDIGTSYAFATIPFIVGGTAIVLIGLAAAIVRSAARRPIAVTLRGAA